MSWKYKPDRSRDARVTRAHWFEADAHCASRCPCQSRNL
jgi:hypothetical protein